MAFCKNHAQVPASGRCAGCAEEFCQNCLVDIQGQKYCGGCKVMVLQGKTPTAALEYETAQAGYLPNQQAKEALMLSIVGLFCFGFILGPVAIYKGVRARSNIAANPQMGGAGMALAGIIIGAVATVFQVLLLLLRVVANT